MPVGEGQWVKGCCGTGKGQECGGVGEDRKEKGGEGEIGSGQQGGGQ